MNNIMLMTRNNLFVRLFGLALCLGTGIVNAQQNETQALATEVALLLAEVQQLEDENEIENLQKVFGFYIDKRHWTQAADLFADDGTLEIGGEGVYVGKERVQEYLQTIMGRGEAEEGPLYGILNDHMQLQPVITIAADGSTAQARWHHFSQEAVYEESHHWGVGIYENSYVKEDGVWKIQGLHLYSTMRTPFDDGWAVTAQARTEPSEILPPDLPPSVDYENYPAVYTVPYHFENPVTGSRDSVIADPARTNDSLDEVRASLAALDNRIGLLQDADDVEYVHVAYGYYLARNQWDDLTGIFADDGTIEIALRGVYVGQPSVRRNLNLYGVQGELPGTLHNHMQYQPVIHVAPDGQSALMRSRALSMMGSYEGAGIWMGGVYENLFVKENGVWKIGTDQVFNTYFANFNQGWMNMAERSPPGVTDTNPPDEPPTVSFTMFPGVHLPPFHYTNPVTGQ
jgi:hypothetical protein